MKKFLMLLSVSCIGQLGGQIITTFAGIGTGGSGGDGGAAVAAELYWPMRITCDAIGNVYITDFQGHRIRKVNPSGIITTIAGNGFGQGTSSGGYSGDGGSATLAELSSPAGIAIDALGNIYIADANNHRIRKVNTSGIITTIVGTGVAGYGGDGGQAGLAKLNLPFEIAFDTKGNLYIADQQNFRVRKVNTSGIITTVAGTGIFGFSGDNGQATNAELGGPSGIALDASDNLYISDINNHRIRKVDTLGVITTIAGTGVAGYSGDGGLATLAKLSNPWAITIDANKNIFIADDANSRVRKINASGIITTVAGNGMPGFSGDGGPATSAKLHSASSLAIDAGGSLYISDYLNRRIRKVTNIVNNIKKPALSSVQTIVYPNPSSNYFSIETNSTDKFNANLYDLNGRQVLNVNVSNKSNIDVSNLAGGIYILRIETVDSVISKKVVIQH
jgi:trimeric autotransporter adhesin